MDTVIKFSRGEAFGKDIYAIEFNHERLLRVHTCEMGLREYLHGIDAEPEEGIAGVWLFDREMTEDELTHATEQIKRGETPPGAEYKQLH